MRNNLNRRVLAETLRTQRSAELLSDLFSFSLEIFVVIQRFLIYNVRYQITALRTLRPCATARENWEINYEK